MNKIYRSITVGLLASALMIPAGCSNFDELNTDPDSTTTASSGMLLTGQLWNALSMGGKSGDKWYFGDMFFTKQISWQEGSQDSRDAQYNVIGRTGLGRYTGLMSLRRMVENANPVDKEAYEGVELFMKAFFMFDATMSLGDIPYSEALKGEEGIFKPKYDTQKEVVQNMLADLEMAYEKFSAASRKFDGDFCYGGDPEKWKKTVSALQLRILINLSKKTNEADLKVVERFASIVANQALYSENDDNFQLVYGKLSSQLFPLYLSKFNMYAGVSTTIVDELKKNEDRRLFYYCEPAKSVADKGADNYDAYLGVNPTDVYSDILERYNEGSISNINNRFWKEQTGQPTIQMGYAELNFVLAEACLRGWIKGNPNDYFHKGIRASMIFAKTYTPETYRHGVEIDEAYITSFLAKPEMQLGCTPATFEKDLREILTQKYLDFFMHNTYWCYYDYRRTGYPEIPINPQTNLNPDPNKMPMRWMYDKREYDYNREALDEALQRQFGGNDDWNELMWIIK